MADKKISELTNIIGADLSDDDEFVVVDTSAAETKAITYAELKKINGDLTVSGTVDGRDLSVDGAKLDGIESGATGDQAASEVPYTNTTSGLTATNVQAAVDEVEGRVDTLESVSHTHANKAVLDATTASFTTEDETKLDGIETNADVTDTANVTAAGALMDSELTNINAVKALDQGVATTDSPSFVGVTATTADIDGGTIDGTTIGGTSAAAGTFTTATATTGNITTINATTVDSTNVEVTNIKAKDGTAAGSIADLTGIVTLASSVLTTTDINGGTIDGVTIGGTSAAAGTFTNLTASGAVNLSGATVSNGGSVTTIDINGGTIDGTTIGGTTPAAVTTSSLVATTADINGGTIDGVTIGGTTPGTVTTSSLVATTADINAGTVDNVVIGGVTPAAGTFTTLTANGNVVLGDAATDTVTVNADVASDLIPSADGTYDLGAVGSEWQDLFVDGTANIDSLVADTADINGGTIDGTTIGGASAAAATFTTATATTVNATTVDTTNIEVTNIKAKDGTAAGSIADATGVVTLASSVLTTTDINGGTIDGVTIGGSSAGAISGTTGQFGTSLNVDGTVTADGLTVDGDVLLSDDGNYTDQTVKISTGSLTVGNKSILAFADQRGTETSKIIGYNSTYGSGLNKAVEINVDGLAVARFFDGGDISFYEDTGTTPKLTWSASAESLGIGTSSPQHDLQIGDGTNSATIGLKGSTSGPIKPKLTFEAQDGSDRFVWEYTPSGAPAADLLSLSTLNASNALTVLGSGNVGIGTSSPTGPLTVANSSNTLMALEADSNRGRLRLYRNGATAYTQLWHNGTDADWSASTGSLTLSTGGSEAMRIDSSGNVGIGVAPKAWGSVFRAVQLGTLSDQSNFIAGYNGAAIMSMGSGVYYDGSNYRYSGTTSGAIFSADQGKFTWSTAASGTAGNVATFTQAMTLDTSGNLLVGTTSAYSVSKATIDYDSTGAFGITLRDTGAATDGVMAYFVKGGTVVGSITSTTSATSYNTSSDYRLKEDVQPMTGASDRVLSLNPVNFAWKADGTRTDGFIAHEAQAVAPYAVTGEKDGEDMQVMDHSKLVPLLTAALQEALTKIEALEARITALEA